jgi:uncharacterized protein
VFVRAPVRGEVKTRLAAGIGADAALRVYRHLGSHAVLTAARVQGAAVRVHYTPPSSGEAVARWLGGGPTYHPQAGGELGERMRTAFDEAFAAGYDRAIIVGSDLPGLTTELLEEAFRRLDQAPAVMGPAADGGYWLLGLREPAEQLFSDIEWSRSNVLSATIARLQSSNLAFELLPVLRDVDEAADLPGEWRQWVEKND